LIYAEDDDDDSTAGEQRVQMQLPNLGRVGEYRRGRRSRRRSISAHKALLAVAIVLAIAVTVQAIRRGDPGPSLGMSDDWSASSAPPAH
jgi:hypothetical protein